jgi:hypothetical protein
MFVDNERKELPLQVSKAYPKIELPAGLSSRMKYLIHIESLINVGCHFGPDDLPASVWEELIALAIERQWVQEKMREKKDRQDPDAALLPKERAERDKARKMDNIPPPGGSIFPSRQPFR